MYYLEKKLKDFKRTCVILPIKLIEIIYSNLISDVK